MNIRQKKKQIKKRWHLKRIPKGTDVLLLDSYFMYVKKELTRRVAERLDHVLLYGEDA